MAQKRKPEQKKSIAAAALSLADVSGWASLDMAKIARKAKVKTADVHQHFDDIWDILIYVLADVEKETQDTVGGYLGDNWRDNVMEILMTRFDIAGRHRVAFSSLVRDIPKRPSLVRRLAPLFYGTMDRMLKEAGLSVPFQPLAVAGFAAVYISVVHVWVKDDTRDQSKTMSAIDKRLELFASALDFVACKK